MAVGVRAAAVGVVVRPGLRSGLALGAGKRAQHRAQRRGPESPQPSPDGAPLLNVLDGDPAETTSVMTARDTSTASANTTDAVVHGPEVCYRRHPRCAESHRAAARAAASVANGHPGGGPGTRSSGRTRSPASTPRRSTMEPAVTTMFAPSASWAPRFEVANPAVGAPKLRVLGRPRNARATASPELPVALSS